MTPERILDNGDHGLLAFACLRGHIDAVKFLYDLDHEQIKGEDGGAVLRMACTGYAECASNTSKSGGLEKHTQLIGWLLEVAGPDVYGGRLGREGGAGTPALMRALAAFRVDGGVLLERLMKHGAQLSHNSGGSMGSIEAWAEKNEPQALLEAKQWERMLSDQRVLVEAVGSDLSHERTARRM